VTRVKICSVQTVEHALTAAAEGADFIGFNFVPSVRRQLQQDVAIEIIQNYKRQHGPDRPKLVGIFADQPLDDVNRILQECGLTMAQLSGQEPMNYAVHIDRPVIKAIHIPEGQPTDLLVDHLDRVLEELEKLEILPLLDPLVHGALGGTGRSFDWAIAQMLAQKHQFLLAGGLSPTNIRQAVEQVHPWGVDVSSGVETSGHKDPSKIKSFIRNARSTEYDE
jgi:phosphoribosylanthranilate isomerase